LVEALKGGVMATKIDDQLTSDDLQAKQIYDEYREIKLLLDYVRRPEMQKVLREMKGSTLDLLKPVIRRRSRI
jgi:hypothetical protein